MILKDGVSLPANDVWWERLEVCDGWLSYSQVMEDSEVSSTVWRPRVVCSNWNRGNPSRLPRIEFAKLIAVKKLSESLISRLLVW